MHGRRPIDKPRTGSRWRVLPVAGALAALSLVAAACSSTPAASVANLKSSTTTTAAPSVNVGGSPNGGGGASGSPQGGAQQSTVGIGGVTVQFAQCMRSHGVADFPDPNSQGSVQISGVNPQSPSFEAAQRACAKYAPGGGKSPSPQQRAKALAQALKFSQCMRNHGVADFPDPVASGGGISISIHSTPGSDLNPSNPTFQAAQKACQSLMPGRIGGPSSGATARG